MYNRKVIEYLAELFSQVMVGGLNPVLSEFCYLLLSDNFNLWHTNNTNKWREAESAWDIPYLSRKIFLFHKLGKKVITGGLGQSLPSQFFG